MKNIIFIISQPRSGSTLLQNILAQSDLIETTSEPWILLPHLRHYKNLYNSPNSVESSAISEFISKNIGQERYLNHYRTFLQNIYKEKVHDKRMYFLDKTPRYYQYLNELQSFFPKAKKIILYRNPIASCISTIERWPKKHLFEYSYKFKDIITSPLILSDFIEKSSDIYRVKYEDITVNPEETLRGVFSFVGIEWQKSFLNMTDKSKIEGTYGDNKIYETSKILRKNIDEDFKNIKSKILINFIRGYAYYLMDKGYDQYDLSFVNPIETSEFYDFVNFYDSFSNQDASLNLLKRIKSSYHYWKYRLY